MSNTRERVVSTILEVLKPERPNLADHSKPLLGDVLDSLDFASMLMAVEEEFSLEFSSQDAEEIGSIDKLVSLIEQKQKGDRIGASSGAQTPQS